jgi:septal ring factor EnvC (AmiA/AmiB activator)
MRWEGLYFQARTGVEIKAIHSGRVVFADWLRGFGLLTIIDHGDEHMSLYGYADVLFKEPGDWVEGGEPIAAAGRSGGQSASGLYFEVRSNGRPTDPIVWLDARQ